MYWGLSFNFTVEFDEWFWVEFDKDNDEDDLGKSDLCGDDSEEGVEDENNFVFDCEVPEEFSFFVGNETRWSCNPL